GLARFAPIPPTRAARWMTRSGRWSAYMRATSDCLVRSYSELENVKISAESGSRRSTTCRPRKPRPPVTVTRWPFQNPGVGSTFGTRQLRIRLGPLGPGSCPMVHLAFSSPASGGFRGGDPDPPRLAHGGADARIQSGP